MPQFTGPVTTAGTSYAGMDDALVGGGYKVVADNTDRDALPDSRRKAGMEVYVQSTGKRFRLGGSVGAWTWTEIPELLAPNATAPNGAVTGVAKGQLYPQLNAGGTFVERVWFFDGTVGANTGWK